MSQLPDKIKKCESIIGYEFTDKRHCVDALYAFSGLYWESGRAVTVKKNDSLGVLGNLVLQHNLCEQWLKADLTKRAWLVVFRLTLDIMKYADPKVPEQWSTIQQETSSNENLAAVGRTHGLDSCVMLNPGTPSVSNKTLATTVEAIIAAVKLDGGETAVKKVLTQLKLNHKLLQVVMLRTLPSFPPRERASPIQLT